MLQIVLGVGVTIVFAVSKIIYNIFIHPLKSYPGPIYAKASIFWSQYNAYTGNLTHVVHELHQKYGPVVRIAPNELVYTDPQAWKDIYGHRNGVPENAKDPSRNTEPDTIHHTIITAEKEKHGQLRRLLSNAFSEKSMKEQEPIIKSYIDLLIERLHDVSLKNCPEGTDMVRWYNDKFTTFDIIGHLTFAESFGCLQNSDYHLWVEYMFAVIKFNSMMTALQRVQRHVAGLIQNMIPERVRTMRLNLYVMTKNLVQRRHATETAYTDFMTHLLSAEKAGKLAAPEVLAQAPVVVIAGSETTATLLSGGTFHLLTNPHVYDRVVSEVRECFSSQKDINLVSINELKYFVAFFDEALRMYPPAAGNLSRVTPPEGTTIAGKWVPGNTTVGIHQYAQFHSAENFANPDVFAPERFLETDDPKWREDKRNALQPFSFGPRNCIGRK
ncbi:hypothetical protein N0V94_005333 [Neodidymelliopsis sp. IMI 364377]|nr:hypothetical protein N0V94_005333 [Neodidymelliopsis sp. IMI 364377]